MKSHPGGLLPPLLSGIGERRRGFQAKYRGFCMDFCPRRQAADGPAQACLRLHEMPGMWITCGKPGAGAAFHARPVVGNVPQSGQSHGISFCPSVLVPLFTLALSFRSFLFLRKARSLCRAGSFSSQRSPRLCVTMFQRRGAEGAEIAVSSERRDSSCPSCFSSGFPPPRSSRDTAKEIKTEEVLTGLIG